MKIIHTHPQYTDDRERLSRLRAMKAACRQRLGGKRPDGGAGV